MTNNTEDAELRYYSFARQQMMAFIPSGCRRVLDVGCGAGVFGALLKQEHGIEVWGVEPYAPAADAAHKNIDHVIHGNFADGLDVPNHYFDVVLFNDSLEHFPDPFPPLELAKQYLVKEGCVVSSIPNVRYIENVLHFLIDMDWEYCDEGIRDRTHLRFFTRKSIIRTFDQAGYHIEHIQGINSHHWSGKKILILRTLFGRWVEDMRYLQYAVVAKPHTTDTPTTTSE